MTFKEKKYFMMLDLCLKQSNRMYIDVQTVKLDNKSWLKTCCTQYFKCEGK